MAPLTIIGHCPPVRRRTRATASCAMPAVTAQTPQTRRAAGMPEARATPRAMPVRALSPTFTHSLAAAPPVARVDRRSTTAQAASKSG